MWFEIHNPVLDELCECCWVLESNWNVYTESLSDKYHECFDRYIVCSLVDIWSYFGKSDSIDLIHYLVEKIHLNFCRLRLLLDIKLVDQPLKGLWFVWHGLYHFDFSEQALVDHRDDLGKYKLHEYTFIPEERSYTFAKRLDYDIYVNHRFRFILLAKELVCVNLCINQNDRDKVGWGRFELVNNGAVDLLLVISFIEEYATHILDQKESPVFSTKAV